ncbi:hypothetical protein PQ469_20920 [Mucilaginibacter sp. KACC 22773]|uniref:hypothetical protein n=1 Tax=Mucilaginibacter sp. KACC 22773 TaxID=3025671 RepID=UPI002366BCBE|nr:hypothetical protein [Mucilaginibacter sp. KACC 22773]WDF76355.1 hypothetical protein PQ469_20920 [Mucilaginibacter sp. KACC 22773]
MKATALLSTLLIILFFSACNSTPSKDIATPKTDMPEPLKDDKSDFSMKRMPSGSLMDEIYDDLAKKDPQLQKLEEQLTHFNGGIADSLKAFNNYAAKSDGYYFSANESLTAIKDTVLRVQLSALIAESKLKYMEKISRFTSLKAHIDSNQIKMDDYHAVLKIVATLPIIEKYQDKNMPDITSTANLANEAQHLKVKTMQLAKKYQKK